MERETFTCKRRIEDGADNPIYTHGGTNLDTWEDRDGVLTCSYDGGVKPSEVLRLIEEGKATGLERTGKYYKYYLHIGDKQLKLYMQHDTEETFNAMIAAAKKAHILA